MVYECKDCGHEQGQNVCCEKCGNCCCFKGKEMRVLPKKGDMDTATDERAVLFQMPKNVSQDCKRNIARKLFYKYATLHSKDDGWVDREHFIEAILEVV